MLLLKKISTRKNTSNKLFSLIIFCFLSTFFITSAYSQNIKSFSTDTLEFIEEFEEYLQQNINDNDEKKLEIFVEKWKTNFFSDTIKSRIISVSNLLLKKKARRNPHFLLYMKAILIFTENEKGIENYDNWEKGIIYILNEIDRPLSFVIKYIKNSILLVENNILNKSNATNWILSSNDYCFEYTNKIKVVVKSTNLTCKIKNDSLTIFNTSGVFDPINTKWEGEIGLVTWERAGYNRENVNAQLNAYTINMTKSGYIADSVKFKNNLYFDKLLNGKLTDQVVHIAKSSKAIYPEFQSYQRVFDINNIYDGINYHGGFIMKGASLIGSGTKEDRAYLKIYKKDTLFIIAKSENFMFKNNRLDATNTQITLKLKNDSIFHSGLQFSYNNNNKEIALSQSDRILSKGAYFDSYHNVTINSERLLWYTNKDKLYFTSRRGGSVSNAIFTSVNFYNLLDYDKIQIRDQLHPLMVLRNFSRIKKTTNFFASELSAYMEYPIYQIRQMLIFLTVDGFIFYDFDTDEVSINKKLFDYVDARLGKIDYDVMKFSSETNSSIHNGVLDLNNYNLSISGIPKIALSDSQNVVIYPRYNKIVMKKDRNFDFAGIIDAGLFTFYGKDFNFIYDKFKIKLDNIDSLNIRVQTDEKDMYNNPLLLKVKSTLQNITGDLLIDRPDNKSGLKNYPQYPIFNSTEKAYVFYNDSKIQKGVYKKDNFFFELDSFIIDSLDNFTIPGLRFNGHFYSADIFPPFDDTLYLRPDNSLGFNRKTPENGFPLYKGKGSYYNMIDLSNKGLRGEGELSYLTSTAKTKDILFFPDSTKVHAFEYNLTKRTSGIEYPKVNSTEIDIKWYPYNDVMYAEQTNKPFNMFNENTFLNGKLTLKPIGLSGKGSMNLTKASITSNLFNYQSETIDADTSDFKLKTFDKTDYTFLSSNIDAHIDFNYKIGNFVSNNGITKTQFPQNLYICYLDKFSWHLDKNILKIESNPHVETLSRDSIVIEYLKLKDDNLPGALFVSLHKSQDSLRFSSGITSFSVENTLLSSSEVEYIKVADALVYPKNNLVNVEKTAKMQTLKKAVIIANNTTKYHRIFDVKLNILGRKKYLGSGDYNYIDENKAIQKIHFTQVQIDTNIRTIATGTILEPDSFTLSPAYRYQGEVKLNAWKQYLCFTGGAKINHNCSRIPSYYTYFESEINPDSIYIPLSKNLKNINNIKLSTASYITKDSSHIYSSFLSKRRDPNDKVVVGASGYLYYDKNSSKYLIAEANKLRNRDSIGNLLSLHKNYCLLHGEGKISTGADLGQLKMNPAGTFNHNLSKNEIKLELTMPIDFFFSSGALDTLIKDINTNPELETFKITGRSYLKNLHELIGIKGTNKFINQVNLYNIDTKFSKEIQHTFILGKIKLKWNTETGSYLSDGPIGISMINNKPINKYVDGYIEILKRRSGDLFRFYIKLPNGNYYFFTYSRGVMQTLSNNKDFINDIEAIKSRHRKLKTPRRETPYRYIIGTNRSVESFLRRMRQIEQAKQELLEEEKITQTDSIN